MSDPPRRHTGSGHSFDLACWDALQQRVAAGVEDPAEITEHRVEQRKYSGAAELWHRVTLGDIAVKEP